MSDDINKVKYTSHYFITLAVKISLDMIDIIVSKLCSITLFTTSRLVS